MNRFRFGDRLARPALLRHAVEVVHGPVAMAERLGVGDGGGDVSFCQKDGFWEPAAVSEMAGQGGGKSTAGAMS